MKIALLTKRDWPSLFRRSGAQRGGRTDAERLAHYTLEKALANRLRESSREERKELYAAVYDEFFQQAPSFAHPQIIATEESGIPRSQWGLLRRFLHKRTVFLEIGAGSCKISLAAASIVKKVYALEVSEEITKNVKSPDNFELRLFSGYTIPDLAEQVDVIYSNQLMEHLHPDDAYEQLASIYNALARKGIYVCVTPNRLSGPHDISSSFDTVATGFHLKEYTNSDLSRLFQQAGFSQVKAYAGLLGCYWRFPLTFLKLLEYFLDKLPHRQCRALARLCLLYNIRLVGVKR